MQATVNDSSPENLMVRLIRAKRTFPDPWMYDEYFGSHVDYTPAHFGTSMTFSEQDIDMLIELIRPSIDIEKVEQAYYKRFRNG